MPGGLRLSVALLGVGLSVPCAYAQDAAPADDIAALQRQLKELAERNQQQIDALQQQVQALTTALAKFHARRPAAAKPPAPTGPVAGTAIANGTGTVPPPVPPPGLSTGAPAGPAGAPPRATFGPIATLTGPDVAGPSEPKPGPVVLEPMAQPMLPPQMMNLPGRSVDPPYTAAGAGTSGAYPVTPAAAMTSGGNRVKLSISGQVDRALLFGYDGHDSGVRQVDNNNSSTRFRIVGEAVPVGDTVAGINLEAEIRPNSSASQTLTQNLPQSASTATFTVRQAEIYGANPQYGEVRLGFGSTASYLTTEIDLSDTSVATYVQVPDFNGGFAFRQKGAALVPSGPIGSALVFSPNNAYGPAVGSVFNYFDGLGRDDRIRYDTPNWNGFQFATSAVDGDAFDFAGRFARDYDDFKIAAGIGLGFARARNHAQPGAYGYAGVPAGANGISLGGTNSAPGSPSVADVSANGSNQFDGAVSVLFKSGLNLTVAGGIRDPHYHDPDGRPLSPDFIYGKIGYQHSFFPIGLTAFSVDFAQNDELIFNNDRARAYGAAVVQNIDPFGMELFVGARYETLNRTFASYHPIIAVMSGARVRF
jgi:hypothetical protein